MYIFFSPPVGTNTRSFPPQRQTLPVSHKVIGSTGPNVKSFSVATASDGSHPKVGSTFTMPCGSDNFTYTVAASTKMSNGYYKITTNVPLKCAMNSNM